MFQRRSLLVGLTLLGVAGAWLESQWQKPPFVAFVDVGQGDCTVIHDAGLDLVIDVAGKTPTHDLGDRLALPELRALHVNKIDLLVLTHPDQDHVGGLKAFLRRYAIGQIAIPARFQSSPHMLSWLLECGVDPTSVYWLTEQRVIDRPGLNVKLSAPPFGDWTPDNEGSMVTQVTAGGKSFLFTGDGDFADENWLVGQGIGHVDVLKAGHHGSNTATSADFLAALTPLETVISCGRKNAYGHPDPRMMERLAEASVPAFRTDRQGDIVIWLDQPLEVGLRASGHDLRSKY